MIQGAINNLLTTAAVTAHAVKGIKTQPTETPAQNKPSKEAPTPGRTKQNKRGFQAGPQMYGDLVTMIAMSRELALRNAQDQIDTINNNKQAMADRQEMIRQLMSMGVSKTQAKKVAYRGEKS